MKVRCEVILINWRKWFESDKRENLICHTGMECRKKISRTQTLNQQKWIDCHCNWISLWCTMRYGHHSLMQYGFVCKYARWSHVYIFHLQISVWAFACAFFSSFNNEFTWIDIIFQFQLTHVFFCAPLIVLYTVHDTRALPFYSFIFSLLLVLHS